MSQTTALSTPAEAAPTDAGTWPSVSVVVATRDRPQLLRQAVAAILGQEYAGHIQCIAVFDQSEPEWDLANDDQTRSVLVLRNERTPGLPGARNTGALAATGDILAFCDDDDEWLPEKLRVQVGRMLESGAQVATTGITIVYGDSEVSRVTPTDVVTPGQLARRRVMEAHPSTFAVRRRHFLDTVGLVDESIPGAYGEDFDWLLRAALAGPVVAVRQPLVRVLWHQKSFFAQRWQTIADATDYLLAKHPVLGTDRRGLAEHRGRRAFALAAAGRRGAARREAVATLRQSPREARAVLALLVSVRVVRADTVMRMLNKAGRGL